jgi:DNA gyrase subunit A
MQLQRLTGLEQDKLVSEYKELMQQIADYLHILSDEHNILDIVREDLIELKQKYGDARRTEISDEEVTAIDREDLIREETMVVTLTHRGYIKRIPLNTYKAQRRGGKGIIGAKSEEEDPIEHLFVASTHDYLLFFTDRGKVYWQKVYDLPLQSRSSRGRAIVNVLELKPEEKVTSCIPVREFDERRRLVMATRRGIVKKTVLSAFKRPTRGGIIAIHLDDDNELIDVVMTEPGDHLVLSTAEGMAIRFDEGQVRAMGRNSRGVKGIALSKTDQVVGMVVVDEEGTLLTACEHGYGKRTHFGPGDLTDGADEDDQGPVAEGEDHGETDEEGEISSGARYRPQNRGGKGLRDIKTTKRNGRVVDAVGVRDDDEVLMITAKGKVQRMAAGDISVIGRNTQGVVIIRLDEDDTLVAIAKVPAEDVTDDEIDEQADSADRASTEVQIPPAPDASGPDVSDEGPNHEED